MFVATEESLSRRRDPHRTGVQRKCRYAQGDNFYFCQPTLRKPYLAQHGSITFWMSDDFEKKWLYTGEKQRGGQFEHSDPAILVMLTVKEVFPLPENMA